MKRRQYALAAAMALWGLATAIALVSIWDRPALPGQLPGLATKLNFDASGPFRWIAGLILLPLLFPIALRRLVNMLTIARTWAFHAALLAPPVALWIAIESRSPLYTILPCAIVLTVAALLRERELDFTRDDLVLLLVFLTTYIAIIDLYPKLDAGRGAALAMLIVFVLRVVIAFIRVPTAPALAFLAAPLGLIAQTSFFAGRYAGWPALVIVMVTPFLLRVFLRDARRARMALAFAIYPIALYAYMNATHLTTAEGAPRVSMFEDSHSLMPAAEYLRGERPYIDMLPAHGLVEDGLFDYFSLHVVEPRIGSTLYARFVVGSLTAVALYVLVFAMTASAHAAMLAVLFGLSAGMLTPSIRVLAALIAIAFLVQAIRTRETRWLIGAGFFNVVQGATSIDFAFYTLVTIGIALLRWPRAWKHTLLGIAAGVIPLFASFAAFGFLGAFFRGTFLEIPSLGAVYTLGFFAKPANVREIILLALWVLAAVFAGATIARRLPRRIEPLLVVCVWMMLAAISYAERQHLYWNLLAPAFVIGGVWMLVRRRHALAPVAIVLAIAITLPHTHLQIVHFFRHARGRSLDRTWRHVPNVPRAAGALWRGYDQKVIASTARYLAAMPKHETFLDFTNRNLLYFLFDRDCPIRYYEVAFYETEERQREVIAALEANPNIRTVLVPGPIGAYPVDGIRNRDRAPLVWAYIERHFRPHFAEGDVVFWRR